MNCYRIRFLIETTERVPQLHPFHGPLIYALLAEAAGTAQAGRAGLPDGVMVIAPEQLRVHLKRDDRFAFGVDLLAADPESARITLTTLTSGLETIGRTPQPGHTLAGNFRLIQTTDLFAAAPLTAGQTPTALSTEHLLQECASLITAIQEAATQITLRFDTPLRWQLPKSQRSKGRRYFDRRHFPQEVFLDRLRSRLEALGLDTSGPTETVDLADVKLISNDLVWLDVDYRNARHKQMKLSGAVGRITFEIPPDFPVHWLVWGQYTHVGESTRFGFGRYRIEELGDDPYRCERSCSLAELACHHPSLERLAMASGVAPGEIRQATAAVAAQEYRPQLSRDVWLEHPTSAPRRLSLPEPVDRALQRAVLETTSPGLDALFEQSSFAYRRGLGRHRAAQAIQRSWDDGFHWAAHADFERFFDSVDHRELRSRLHAYLGDPMLESLLMSWVLSDKTIAKRGRGLPTGAPISPLLANLFLDRFDELIAKQGGRLVRYADDFLILTRTKHEAERMFETARAAAEQFRLTLNRDKSKLVNLREDFDFLGFRFECREEWLTKPRQPPQPVERLGWVDSSQERPRYASRFLLPGESNHTSPLAGTTCIIDSDATWVGVENGHIVVSSNHGSTRTGPELSQVRELLIVGPTSLDRSLVEAIEREQLSIVLANHSGRIVMEWIPDDGFLSAELLTAQVAIQNEDNQRLEFSRPLIAAKLENYAALADVIPHASADDDTSAQLRTLAEKAQSATDIATLLGYEGAGAAAWYGSLPGRLPSRFPFYRRIAPRAKDPINVMLNIAHTHLYRQCKIAIRLVGLNPALGVLHRGRGTHAALASDLQEPFRILADRAVIETAWKVQWRDFRKDELAHYPLTVLQKARRRLLGTLEQALLQPALSVGSDEPFAFRGHLFRLARSFREALRNEESSLRIYRCPPAEIS